MAPIEQKLHEIRARRKRKEIFLSFKNRLLKLIAFRANNDKEKAGTITVQENSIDEEDHLLAVTDSNEGNELAESSPDVNENSSLFTVATRIIYFLLWITCYAIAVQLEFGVIFLIVSGLYFIWLNTRVGPKRGEEVSAYSVFNPNCESIDGTLKVEHFEKAFGYRAASVS